MRFLQPISILIPLYFISCTQKNDCSQPIGVPIVKEVLTEFIRIDSLGNVKQAVIAKFNYSRPEYVDGLLIPSPPGSANVNEFDIITFVDNESYFSEERDGETIKEQIENSYLRTPDIFHHMDTYDSTAAIYTFYVSIFNCDRSVAFVSYTYDKEGYWEYNGAVMQKIDGTWNIVLKIPLGMN